MPKCTYNFCQSEAKFYIAKKGTINSLPAISFHHTEVAFPAHYVKLPSPTNEIEYSKNFCFNHNHHYICADCGTLLECKFCVDTHNIDTELVVKKHMFSHELWQSNTMTSYAVVWSMSLDEHVLKFNYYSCQNCQPEVIGVIEEVEDMSWF